MTISMGIDPGMSPGYALWSTMHSRLVHFGDIDPGHCGAHHIAVEGGWIGPMSKQAMWTLGCRARGRLDRALAANPTAVGYVLPPRVWRGVHWPSNGDRLPKDIIVARLRQKYGLAADVPDDVVEACGIAEALAVLVASEDPAHVRQLKACRIEAIDAGRAGTARVARPRPPRARKRVAP